MFVLYSTCILKRLCDLKFTCNLLSFIFVNTQKCPKCIMNSIMFLLSRQSESILTSHLKPRRRKRLF